MILTANVLVTHPHTGERQVLLDGSVLPEWALEPKVLVGDPSDLLNRSLTGGTRAARPGSPGCGLQGRPGLALVLPHPDVHAIGLARTTG